MTLQLLRRSNEYAVRFRNNEMYSWAYLSPKHLVNEFPYKKSLIPVWMTLHYAENIYKAVEDAITKKVQVKLAR